MTQEGRVFSRLPREQRVADIMAAARRVFAEKGYDEASVAQIAARAGVVEGSVYRYFEHKRALLVKVVEDWYEEMLGDFQAQLALIDGTWNRFRFMVWKHLANIQKEPALSRLVFTELRPGPDYRQTSVFDLNRRYTHRTIEILREGQEAGVIHRNANLGLVRDMVYGCIEHHTWAFLRGEGSFDVDAAADGITRIVRAGVSTEAAAPEPSFEDTVRRLETIVTRFERARPAEEKHVPKSPRRKPR